MVLLYQAVLPKRSLSTRGSGQTAIIPVWHGTPWCSAQRDHAWRGRGPRPRGAVQPRSPRETQRSPPCRQCSEGEQWSPGGLRLQRPYLRPWNEPRPNELRFVPFLMIPIRTTLQTRVVHEAQRKQSGRPCHHRLRRDRPNNSVCGMCF